MRPLLVAAVLLVAATARARPELRSFESPAEALASLLVEHPRVIAFGEYHEIKGGAKVPSAIQRFQTELFGPLEPTASDLIVETWVTEGHCGKQEQTVVAKVEETTQRPETTESEVVTLIKRAKAAGVQPHILTVSCAAYQALLDEHGEIDYVKLLGTVTDLLRGQIELALRGSPPERTVLVYGGALHNDLHPRRELRQFSFGSSVQRRVRGKYLEVDLYVPEFIEHDREITAESWYPLWARLDGAKTTLVKRGPGSYIVVFPRTPAAKAAPATP